jgi:ribosomal protein S18 acetylase RimI-like enzyme
VTALAPVVPLGPEHLDALQRFFAALPDEDVAFMKEDVRDASLVGEFVEPSGRVRRWVVEHGGEVLAYAALLPLVGWSDHVGELRLAVAPAQRRQGLGRTLAQAALLAALEAGLTKVVVEVVAEQEAAAEMFRRLGFEGEALLRDQVRDRSGELRDVLLLAHFAEDTSSALSTIGADGS